jgi:hypothetical protein
MKLTVAQRAAPERYVFDGCLSMMFGDGMEDGYIMDGFPEFKGINSMSDDELLAEAGTFSTTDEVKTFLEEVEAGK